jgi:hypothetical protein
MTHPLQNSDIKDRTLEHYGRAMLLTQYLEVSIITAYLLIEVAPKKRNLLDEQEHWVDEIYKQTNSMLDKTLGGMVRKLYDTGKVSPEALQVLQTALAARNKLSHGFFLGRPLSPTATRSNQEIFEDIESCVVAICLAAEFLEINLDKMRPLFGLEAMHLAATYKTIRSYYDHAA